MAYSTPKTVWKSTALPDDVHDWAKWVALDEKKKLGELLDGILRPVLKPKYDALRKRAAKGDVSFKRQMLAAANGKARR